MFKEPEEGQCSWHKGSSGRRAGEDGQGQIAWGLVGALEFGSGSWQNELYRAGTLSVSTPEHPALSTLPGAW